MLWGRECLCHIGNATRRGCIHKSKNNEISVRELLSQGYVRWVFCQKIMEYNSAAVKSLPIVVRPGSEGRCAVC